MFSTIRLFLIAAFIFLSNYAISQIATEINTGRPFREIKDNEVHGSPYLYDEWKAGSVTLADGTVVDNVKLRFDVLHNKFLYSQHDTTFEFANDVRQITLKDGGEDEANRPVVFEKVINANDKIPAGTFVQVLVTGKVTLLKHHLKQVEGENTTNGMFSTTKQIVPHDSYWASVNNQTIPVKLNKHFLEDITSDKKDQVSNYIKMQKLNVKEEKDFASAINYYNTISVTK